VATSELAKQLRKAIKSRLRPKLREFGFEDCTEMAVWRNQDQCSDCVMFQTYGPKYGVAHTLGSDEHGRALKESSATFGLSVGTYYEAVHVLPWLGPVPVRPLNIRGESSKKLTVHREIGLARSIPMGSLRGTVFYVREDGGNLDEMVDDALTAILSRGLPWLAKTRDVDAYIAWGLTGKPITQRTPQPLELSTEDQAAFQKWIAEHEMGTQTWFVGSKYPADLPPGVRAHFEAAHNRHQMDDHTAMDIPPHGEVLLGLLVSRGRWDEAIAIQERAADPAPLEAQLSELEHSIRNSYSKGGIHPSHRMTEREFKRFLSHERKMRLRICVRQRELLDKLLALREASSQSPPEPPIMP
jgi:hypothetical protein